MKRLLDFKSAVIVALALVLGLCFFPELPAGVLALTGTVVGFFLAIGKSWYERDSRVAAHKKALAAEVEMCVKRAKTYRHPLTDEDKVKSPAYRCPTDAFAAAFPWLLQDGALPADDVTTIEEFYAEVADFNRCLDYCHAARYYRHPGESDDARLNQEYGRAQRKAERVLEKEGATIEALAVSGPSRNRLSNRLSDWFRSKRH